MTAETFLSSATEVAIGIAGFAGIIAAIRHRDLSAWAAEDRLLLRMLLVASGVSVLFSWLPIILFEAGVGREIVWRGSSLVLLVWHTSTVVYRIRQLRRLGLGRIAPNISAVWNAGIILFQIANLYLAESWPYLLGIAGILINAFMFFLVLLLGRPSDTPD